MGNLACSSAKCAKNLDAIPEKTPIDPAEQAKVDDQVRVHFPKAMRQKDVLFAAVEISKRLGLTGPNTLFTHSCCPDEINH